MAPAPKKDASVYDFLYVDSRRIALFNSQFSEFGHLTSLTKTASESNSESGGIGGGLKVVSAKLDSANSSQAGLSRQFDTQWVAPLTFLDNAQQQGLIIKGIGGANVGQLVLESGSLSVVDVAIFKVITDNKILKANLLSSANGAIATPSRSERRRHQTNTDKPPSMIEIGIELIGAYPLTVQATIKTNSHDSIWSSLRREHMIVTPEDLLLQHGVEIPGQWHVLGIMDARPDEALTSHDGGTEQEAIQPIPVVLGNMAPAIRTIIGRPPSAFGLTPLMIFRSVSG